MAIFSCFDVETTSLDAKKGQVIEIAIVKVNDEGELLDEWMTFCLLYTSDAADE